MLILPKTAEPAPQGLKVSPLDKNDSFTLWVVVVDDTQIALVTTSKRKARRRYDSLRKVTSPELWKKTVTLIAEGPPVYQVVSRTGEVLHEDENHCNAAAYQMGRKLAGVRIQRVTTLPNREWQQEVDAAAEAAEEVTETPTGRPKGYKIGIVDKETRHIVGIVPGVEEPDYDKARKLRKRFKLEMLAPGCTVTTP